MHFTIVVLRSIFLCACVLFIPLAASAQAGSDACNMAGLFDRRAKAACEQAAKMAPPATQNRTRTVPAPRAESYGQVTDADEAAPAADAPMPAQPAPGARSAATSRYARPPPPRRVAAAAAPQTPANGPYQSSAFSGLPVWRQTFDKAAHSPKEFEAMRAKMKADANSLQGNTSSVVYGARRNDVQKFLTDYELYRLYNFPEALFTKQNQCLEARDYSAEEACDCMAGFPGETLIGPGAGELVTRSNHAAASRACGAAAAQATVPALKARYTAQQGRAEIYTTDPGQGLKLADAAIAAGYSRAAIVKAEVPLWELEFMSGGFPPMTEQLFKDEMQAATEHVSAAKKAKVPETYLVARKYREFLAHVKFNNDLLKPLLKEMMADPPKSAQSVNCISEAQGYTSYGSVNYVAKCR